MKYIFLVFGLFLTSTYWYTFQAQVSTPIVDFCPIIPPGPFENGQIIEVPVLVTGFSKINYFNVPIGFNSSFLSYVGGNVVTSSGLPNSTINAAIEADFIVVDLSNPDGQDFTLTDNSLLFSIRFRFFLPQQSLEATDLFIAQDLFFFQASGLEGEMEVSVCGSVYIQGPLCPLPGENCVATNVVAQMSLDELSNCSPAEENLKLSGWDAQFISFNNQDTFSIRTNADGKGYLALPAGTYSYQWIPPVYPDLWGLCYTYDAFTIDEVDTLIVIEDLADPANISCSETFVGLSSSLLRPCFTNNRFRINYGNYGPNVAEDAYVDFFLSPVFEILNTSVPYTIQTDGSYRFFIGDLSAGETGAISVVGRLDCDFPVGLTLCGSAFIGPNGKDCATPAPSFEGAELSATSVCLDNEVRFNVINEGTGPTGLLNYLIIKDDLVFQEALLDLAAGEEELITVPADGSTYRLEVALPSDAPYETQALAIEEGCGGVLVSRGFVTALPLLDGDPWLDRYCQETTAAYDPNDKQAIPKGVGENHLIAPNTTVDYKIRFQNTGTDTAFNVIIRDTIDTEVFDLNTLELGAASHDFFLRQTNGNALEFVFNNIQLPDSTIDEPNSHGYVHFNIDQLADLPDGTRLSNRAGIYFDFNPPIITNESWHIVGRDLLSTSVRNFSVPGGPVAVYPNPFQNGLQFEHEQWPGALTFELFDQLGRQLFSAELRDSGSLVELPALPQGTYNYRLIQADQLLQTGMLVKD